MPCARRNATPNPVTLSGRPPSALKPRQRAPRSGLFLPTREKGCKDMRRGAWQKPSRATRLAPDATRRDAKSTQTLQDTPRGAEKRSSSGGGASGGWHGTAPARGSERGQPRTSAHHRGPGATHPGVGGRAGDTRRARDGPRGRRRGIEDRGERAEAQEAAQDEKTEQYDNVILPKPETARRPWWRRIFGG